MDRKTIFARTSCELRQLPLDAVEAFVLSQVDGHSTLEEIGAIAGLDFVETSRLARRLVELGAVRSVDARGDVVERRPGAQRPATERTAIAQRPVAASRPLASAPSAAPASTRGRALAASMSEAQSAKPDPRAEHASVRPPRTERIDPRADPLSDRQPRIDAVASAKTSSAKTADRSEGGGPQRRRSTKSIRSPRTRSTELRGTRPESGKATANGRPSRGGMKASAGKADETSDLDAATTDSIESLDARLARTDHYALLGVPRDADKRTIKRAYFGLASKYHPDRFFTKKLGKSRAPLERIFARITLALDTLTEPAQRASYDATLPPAPVTAAVTTTAAAAPAATAPPAAANAPAKESPTSATKEPTSTRSTRRPEAPRKASTRLAAASTKTPPPNRRASSKSMKAARRASSAGTNAAPASPPSQGRFRRIHAAAKQIEAQRRAEIFLQAAAEAMKIDDVIGAANNYRLALQHADDPYIRQKLEAIDQLAKMRRCEKYLFRARASEREGKWADAAQHFVLAFDTHADASVAERAANAISRAGGETKKAIALAEQAVALAPTNAAYFVTLGELCLAANQIERAGEAAERALALAPNDARIKELASTVRKKR